MILAFPEYMQFFAYCKVECKKIMSHDGFNAIAARFWALLRASPSANLERFTVNKSQYCNLMRLIYKVLMPVFREDEMKQEIEQEWIQDSHGHQELTFHLFKKSLFRIAHAWAVHISVEEYVELLTKIYHRITIRKVIKA